MQGRAASIYRVALIPAFFAAIAILSARTLSADSFDWRNVASQNWNTPAKSQFGGTCWAHGPTSSVEAKYMLTRNDSAFVPDLSEQQLVWADDPDLGSTQGGGGFDILLDYYKNHGVVSEAELPVYPDSAYWDAPPPGVPLHAADWQTRCWKLTSWTKTSNSAANLKNMLKINGPIVMGFNADDLYASVADLKAKYAPRTNSDDHSVSLVGYCDDATCPTGGYWVIKNSWGTGGGDNGFYYVPYASSLEGCNHLYTITGAVYYTGAMATVTWQGGSTWSKGGSNWSGVDQYGNSLPTYAWENKETAATFNTPGGNVSLDGTVIARGLTISSGATGYVFNAVNGGALTVTGGGIQASESVTINAAVTIGAPQTWTIDSGKSLTIGGLHTIVSDLTINSAGNVCVNGAIDGGGVLNANGAAPGSITFNGAGSFSAIGAGNVPVNFANNSAGGLYISVPAGPASTWSGVISGSGGGAIRKIDLGTLIFTRNNSYSAATYISGGVLQADSGAGLPTASFLYLDGGVLQSNSSGAVTFKRSLGVPGSGTFEWSAGGGFSAGPAALTVNVGNQGTPSTLTWGNTPGSNIIGTLKFGSTTSQNVTTFRNPVNLNGVDRTINVDDNPATAADYTVMSGAITYGSGTAGLTKTGGGVLCLTAGAGYNGATTISGGVVQEDLPSNGFLGLDGGVWESLSGGTFTRGLGGSGNTFKWTANGGGFSSASAPLTVNVGGGAALTWGSSVGSQIVGTLKFGSTRAASSVDFQNSINLNGLSRTIQVDDNPNSTGDFSTLSGAISEGSGPAGIVKTGAGMLRLAGSNSYTGVTYINAGAIQARNINALGSTAGKTVVAAGAVLSVGGGLTGTINEPIDLSGDGGGAGALQAVDSGTDVTFAGTINLIGDVSVGGTAHFAISGDLIGAGSFTKYGSNRVDLNGAGTFAGDIRVAGGTLSIASGSLQNNMLNTVAGDAGTLLMGTGTVLGGLKGNGNLSLGGNSVSTSIGNNNQSTTYGGVLGNTALNKIGTGVLTLTGMNTFTGGVTISAGTLSVSTLAANGASSNLGAGTNLTLNGGTLQYTGGTNSAFNRVITLGANGGVINQGGSGVLYANGAINGTGPLTKSGAAQLILQATSTYSGVTTVSTGNLQIRNVNALGSTAGKTVVAYGAILSVGGGLTGTINEALDLNDVGDGKGALQVVDSGTDVTFAGTINLATSAGIGGTSHFAISGNMIGLGGLIKYGTNRVDLNNTGTFTGLTRVAAGTLGVYGNALQDSTLNMFSGDTGTLVFGSGVVLGGLRGYRNLGLAGDSTPISIGNDGESTLYGGVLSSAALNKIGAGVLTLTGMNTFSGGVTVSGGALSVGTLAANGANSNLGAGTSLTLDGGTLKYTGGANNTFNRSITLGAGGGVINQSGSDALYANGVIGGSGPLTKTGAAALVLQGANTYSGITTVTAGTLELGVNAQDCVFHRGGVDIQGGKLVFDYASGSSTPAAIEDLLTASRGGGLWAAGPLRNSTAAATGMTLGWLDNGSGAVTVMATYPGDFNLDGVVNGPDLAVWKANFGASGAYWAAGDANYDGVVNAIDLNLWKQNFGKTVMSGSGVMAAPASDVTPVPEPGTLALLAAALIGLLACGWGKRR
jgi:fibronectin-binding autotransporter adhesin